MLIYGVTNLPDITLSKYQAVEESGIESMLEAQTDLLLLEKLLHITFIPMIHRGQAEINLKFLLYLQLKNNLNSIMKV